VERCEISRRNRLSKDDVPYFAKLGGIFVAIGVFFGLCNGDGIIEGALAGGLMFLFVFGIGYLCSFAGD